MINFKVFFRVFFFLIINFAALAIGAISTVEGVPSDWYINLNKAPWTPPGWVFSVAWSTIMIAFAFYMSYLWSSKENKKIILVLYIIQLALNISWNPAFFLFHDVVSGLVIISVLTILIGYLLIKYYPALKLKSILIFPYFLWLLIATSLNAYIFFMN